MATISMIARVGVTFKTTVFPAAIALRAGHKVHQTGKFHGPMTSTTPSGSLRIRHLLNLKVIFTGTYSSFAQLSIYCQHNVF